MPDNSDTTLRRVREPGSTEPYYVACWIGYGGICRCGHLHPTIASAMACLIFEDSFMRAVAKGREPSLDRSELQVFRMELCKSKVARMA